MEKLGSDSQSDIISQGSTDVSEVKSTPKMSGKDILNDPEKYKRFMENLKASSEKR